MNKKKKWNVYLSIYTCLLLLIFVFAYLRLIPTELKMVPFYDSIGHFVLYGIWGYLFAKVFDRQIRLNILSIPIGVLITFGIAVVEESLQSLSSVRTFSLYDLGWGVLGIFLAGAITHLSVERINNL